MSETLNGSKRVRWEMVLEYNEEAEKKSDLLNKMEAMFDSNDTPQWWIDLDSEIRLGDKVKIAVEIVETNDE